jgi:hypothetical protein
MTSAYRREVERRYTERTVRLALGQTVNPEEVLPEYRVTQSEMRQWALDTFGMRPPIEEEWARQQAAWYRRLMRKVLREADEQSGGGRVSPRGRTGRKPGRARHLDGSNTPVGPRPTPGPHRSAGLPEAVPYKDKR